MKILILKLVIAYQPDLAVSKLAAGREKDWPFVAVMLEHGIVSGTAMVERVKNSPLNSAQQQRLINWLASRTIPPATV